MDPEAIKRLEYEKRRKIVNEILSTEDGYVKALDYMVNVCVFFLLPSSFFLLPSSFFLLPSSFSLSFLRTF